MAEHKKKDEQPKGRNIDERLDALTANVEVMSGMLRDLLKVHARNEKLLASLVNKRLDNLEGGR